MPRDLARPVKQDIDGKEETPQRIGYAQIYVFFAGDIVIQPNQQIYVGVRFGSTVCVGPEKNYFFRGRRVHHAVHCFLDAAFRHWL